MKETLEFAELEQVYDLLAEAIDEAGPEQEALFLAKLAMLLAQQIPDVDRIREAVATALRP
ncbi:DUF2783 domain-containing protein [Haliea sp. E1-2-M8]|uniref:DUF2783 domain-containing protein n=1 Tax=Haliea sp. E1-2-M8 TaxID=3064706 RepID=UPI002727E6FA|nr:DUF2783 domain-containing protein [Haliea sp. E1-2-M8]MDO8861951.1 DUF2783 domain-containing protein [Haliea sp. E1-2-M8]